MGAKTKEKPTGETKAPKLMCQKDIAKEFGIPTRDILNAVQKMLFPMPVRVIGKKRWFRRSDIVKYFQVQDQTSDSPLA